MGFGEMFKPLKNIVEDGLEKITPEDKEEREWDNPDENNGKFFEKGPEDFEKEEKKRKEGRAEEETKQL